MNKEPAAIATIIEKRLKDGLTAGQKPMAGMTGTGGRRSAMLVASVCILRTKSGN